jgi:hypothetical protein
MKAVEHFIKEADDFIKLFVIFLDSYQFIRTAGDLLE